MAHGALGAASLAAAQVGRGAAGREGPGRWAAAHRLSRLKFLTLLNTYCSSCLVLVDCIFSSLDSGWSFAVSFFSLVLKMRKWKEGQTAWPPLCALAPTSPSLPCPRCAPDLGAGRFSQHPVATVFTTGGIPGKLGPGVRVYLKPGDSVWVGVFPL